MLRGLSSKFSSTDQAEDVRRGTSFCSCIQMTTNYFWSWVGKKKNTIYLMFSQVVHYFGARFDCRTVATRTWRRSSFLPARASKTPSLVRCHTGTMWSPPRSNRGRGSSLLPMETVWGGLWSILKVRCTVGSLKYPRLNRVQSFISSFVLMEKNKNSLNCSHLSCLV